MEKFKDRLKHFQDLFGLENWKIIVDNWPQDVDNRQAKTLADPRYNQATMTVYPRLLANPSVWDEILVHELVHITMATYDFLVDNVATPETEDLFFMARESSVSTLTSILIRVIK